MASLLGLFNRLLPFATPGTPFIQDLLHLGAICVLLYFAPQIQDRLQKNKRTQTDENEDDVAVPEQDLQPQDDDLENDHQFAANEHNAPLNPNEAVGVQNQHQPPAGALHDEDHDEADPGEGPADGPNRPNTQRAIGAKKAKSLARRDQRRAYNEFMRNQGEAQRAADAENANEREVAQAAERERRRAAEAALEAKKIKEREQRREREAKAREEEAERRERTVTFVREELSSRRPCSLIDVAKLVGGDVDDVWVEKLLRASGVLGQGRNGELTMVTSTGWVVTVKPDDMARLYQAAEQSDLADERGAISFANLATLLEKDFAR